MTLTFVRSSRVRDIQVSGLTNFSGERWREAILYYLFGIWSNNDRVVYRPKIVFGDITLRLDPTDHEYYAYGHADVLEDVPPHGPDDLIETSGKQAAVEVALIRFVKDDRIRRLRLGLLYVADDATLVLWKKDKRGQYGCVGIGLPYTWSTKGPVWTKAEFEEWFSGS